MTERGPATRQAIAERLSIALTVERNIARRMVIAQASRIVDVLRGRNSGAHILPAEDRMHGVTSVPAGMPVIGWGDVWTGATPGTPVEELGAGMTTNGSVGEYFTSLWSNERPVDVFNAAFYAGALAAKEGLIDLDQFQHDSELSEIVDQSVDG